MLSDRPVVASAGQRNATASPSIHSVAFRSPAPRFAPHSRISFSHSLSRSLRFIPRMRPSLGIPSRDVSHAPYGSLPTLSAHCPLAHCVRKRTHPFHGSHPDTHAHRRPAVRKLRSLRWAHPSTCIRGAAPRTARCPLDPANGGARALRSAFSAHTLPSPLAGARRPSVAAGGQGDLR